MYNAINKVDNNIISGNILLSNPYRLFIICHGHIAKNAAAITPIFLLYTSLNKQYITINEVQLIIAIGNLVANSVNPKSLIKGINKYVYNAFCPLPHDTRKTGNSFPFLSIP